MDTTQIRNLAFLMSLGGLSSACGDDSKNPLTTTGTATAGTTNTTAGTTNTTNSTNGTGPATDSDGTGSATDGTGQQPTDGGTETSVGPLTTGTTDDGGTLTSVGPVTTGTTGFETETDTGVEAPPICTTYADKIVECYPRAVPYHDDYVTYCGMTFENAEATDGPACAAALEDVFACLSALDCADLASDMCMAQSDALATACPNL